MPTCEALINGACVFLNSASQLQESAVVVLLELCVGVLARHQALVAAHLDECVEIVLELLVMKHSQLRLQVPSVCRMLSSV